MIYAFEFEKCLYLAGIMVIYAYNNITGSNISLIWIHGHSIIKGNEQADEHSKKAIKPSDV